jgi:HD-GYP domain-containing protein (c-di-GMP phosphodiesterase class II)
MRRVHVDELRTGDRLGRDVYATPDALPLLRAGVRVSDSYRLALQRAGIVAVWIDDGLSEGIEPLEVLKEETKLRATAAIRDAFREITQSPASGAELAPGTVHEMQQVAELIVSDVARNVHSALALNDLANADGYTLRHSLAVTTLGLSLGMRVMRKYGWIDGVGKRRFDGVEDRLSPLGVGLLLHDIGKLAVPSQILQKPGPLTDDEWQAMRAHPLLGVQILKKAEGISPLSRAVVRSHHERWNGSGYPDKQSGVNIHQFARIAAVADVFDALTSQRAYRGALAASEGWEFIVGRSGKDFDPEVVNIFKSYVAPYPPGTCVVLSDGCRALVKDVKPDDVARPIVRVIADPSGTLIAPQEIDLSRCPEVKITATDVVPVGASTDPVPVEVPA